MYNWITQKVDSHKLTPNINELFYKSNQMAGHNYLIQPLHSNALNIWVKIIITHNPIFAQATYKDSNQVPKLGIDFVCVCVCVYSASKCKYIWITSLKIA